MESRACLLFAAFWMFCVGNTHLAAQAVVSQSQYRFQHFDTKDGLPSEYVNSIAQDSLGFLWMQFYGGLGQFDGYNFKIYKHDQNDTARSLLSGTIGKIVADPRGNIWITEHTQTQDYPLTKYDRKTDSFKNYKPDLNQAIVNGFRFDKTSSTIWFATAEKGLFSFNPETLETKNYLNNHPDPLIRASSNFIWDISDRGSCLLLASRKGLWKFDKSTKTFSRPNCNPRDSALLYHSSIRNIDDGPNHDYNRVWLHLYGKLLAVNKDLTIVQRFSFPDGFELANYEQDKEGILWFATLNNGLYRYNPTDSSLINITHIAGDPYSLRSNNLNFIKVDRDQNIWIATHRGVSRLQKQSLRFYNFNLSGGRIDESTVFRADDRDYIIISKIKKDETEILISPIIPDRLDSLTFKTISVFKKSRVLGLWKGKKHFWISVYSQGIAGIPINPISGMIQPSRDKTTLSHDPANQNTISSNLTLGIREDAHGNLWVCTRNTGLNKVVTNIPYGTEGSVVRYRRMDNDPNSLGNDIVYNLHPENENSLWIITRTGVDLFRNGRFEHIIQNKNSPTSIYPTSIYESPDSTLFIGGVGGLYECIRDGDHHSLSRYPLLKTGEIIRIQEDKLGRLWLSNTRGIVCYDRNESIAIEFNENDGLDHTRTINPWYREYATSKGIIVISDQDGISLFDPVSLQINRLRTSPVFTGLTINNQFPAIGKNPNAKNELVISKDISLLDELALDYRHNNFEIEFSSMEMTAPERNRYRHKLEGFDKDWIETDWKNRTATYTNLDAGHYVFKVRASNHHGIWSDHEKTLIVRVLPPPWKTWWAYSLYGLAFIGISLSLRSYDIKRVKLKNRAEHLSELDNLKTRFFANISHEFRTPTTLILGPLKEMYQGNFKGDQRRVLGTMLRNGQRLMRLINQLLDLSKIEAGKMKLHTAPTNLVEFLREIASSYESLATDKKIKYFFYPEVQDLIVYIDEEKMEKVIHNILSNAFKFTKAGDEIILNLKAEKNICVLAVKDTGIGIPADQLDKVFDRFYQVDSSHTRTYEGSGLGMALAKELMEVHKGSISVQSTEGKGTTFTVILPLGKEHLNKDEIMDLPCRNEEKFADVAVAAVMNSTEKEPYPSLLQPVLLIVEDNADMRHYIRKNLTGQYRILEAENGKAGVKLAEETLPDLIISDIMMPEMDGYKLCKGIKTNELTSHIPVILLTAKADRESKLSGLETGADDYLSKPFDADELRLIVRNRIEKRRKMRERFSKEITLEPRQISITSLDEKFLSKVLAIIEEHMDDENFSIEELSREAGFSSMHFYRKIKALTGQPPSPFLRTIRLKRAADLLSKNSDNISQIAYSVGFSSVSYFCKCFKEQFGVTPRQFPKGSLKSKVLEPLNR